MFSQTVLCVHKVGKHYENEIRFLVGEKQKQTVESFVGILLLMSLKCFNWGKRKHSIGNFPCLNIGVGTIAQHLAPSTSAMKHN